MELSIRAFSSVVALVERTGEHGAPYGLDPKGTASPQAGYGVVWRMSFAVIRAMTITWEWHFDGNSRELTRSLRGKRL